MSEVVVIVTIAGFGFGALCGAIRLLRGPTLADRVVALDVILISFMGAIAASAAGNGDTTYLGILVVISIVGFTATVAASRFIEHEAGRR